MSGPVKQGCRAPVDFIPTAEWPVVASPGEKWVKHEPNEVQFDRRAGFTVNCCLISAELANALFCLGRATLSVEAAAELLELGYHDAVNDPAELEQIVKAWSHVSPQSGEDGGQGPEAGGQKDWFRGNAEQPGPVSGAEDPSGVAGASTGQGGAA